MLQRRVGNFIKCIEYSECIENPRCLACCRLADCDCLRRVYLLFIELIKLMCFDFVYWVNSEVLLLPIKIFLFFW